MDASDRMLARTARASGWTTTAFALASLAMSSTMVALPALFGLAVDAALGRHDARWALYLLVGLLGFLTVAEMLVGVLERYVATGTATSLRKDFVRKVLALGLTGQHRFDSGDLLVRMLQGASNAAHIAPTLVTIATTGLTAVAGVVALALIDWRLPLVLAVGVPLGFLIGRLFMRRMTDASTRYMEAHGRMAARFVEAVEGARTIRASGSVDAEIERVLRPLPQVHAIGMEIWEAGRTAGWHVSLLAPALQIAVLATAGFGVAEGRVTPGQLLAANGYLGLAMGLMREPMLVGQLGVCRSGARRLRELLDARGGAGHGDGSLPDGPGNLELRDVTLEVGGERILDAVSLVVEGGTVLAVVGNSGTGKSTLASVAGHLLEPNEGEVRLDGAPLRGLSKSHLRAAVSYAFESPRLVGQTVADAVGYADLPLPRERVEGAIQHARAGDFVRRLPEGADTPLQGLALSGGERQRLGIARAAARAARLVILDDAMSSLDTATEVQVAAALDDALGGATVLVIAHRVSTAARADRVAWLEAGRIRAVGCHAELWADPSYRKLFGAADRPDHADRPDETAADAQAGASGAGLSAAPSPSSQGAR